MKTMKNELSVYEMNQVVGGRTDENDFAGICRISMSISEYWEEPCYDALCARMEEMIHDDNVWTYDGVLAQLQAIEPGFHVVY